METNETNYPLYPELSEEGQKEAVQLIESFKSQLKKAAEETIESLYVDIMDYIESDSWNNFRNQIMSGFRNYDNRKIQNEYDFKNIRTEIYKEFRSEIIVDLNQDLINENEDLKKQIEHLNRINNHY